MTQSKVGSFIEATINILIGYGISVVSQIVIFPYYGVNLSLTSNLWISAWFTAISLVRSYFVRRWFNARLKAQYTGR